MWEKKQAFHKGALGHSLSKGQIRTPSSSGNKKVSLGEKGKSKNARGKMPAKEKEGSKANMLVIREVLDVAINSSNPSVSCYSESGDTNWLMDTGWLH